MNNKQENICFSLFWFKADLSFEWWYPRGLRKFFFFFLFYLCTTSLVLGEEKGVPVIVNEVINSCIGKISIGVTDGDAPYTFVWTDSGGTVLNNSVDDSGGATEIDMLMPGDYTVVVTDMDGQTDSKTWRITDPPDLTSTFILTDVACKGARTGRIDVTMTNGVVPYTWELTEPGGSRIRVSTQKTFQATGLIAGAYSMKITDFFGCEGQINFNIDEPAVALGLDEISLIDPLCANDSTGSITVEGTGGTVGAIGYSYEWTNVADDIISNKATVSMIPSGIYEVTVTDENACQYTETFELIDPPQLQVTDTVTANASCNGFSDGAIDITVAGGTGTLSYSWDNGENTEDLTGVAAGTYEVTITDDNGCTLIESYTITQPTAVVVTGTAVNIRCRGESTGSISVNVSGGSGSYTYLWDDGTTSLNRSNLPADTYTIIVTDDTGCTATETYTLTEPADGLNVDGFNDTAPTCAGGNDGTLSVNVSGGVAPYFYRWSNGRTTQNISALTADTYSVRITDANGCRIFADFTLIDPTPIAANPTFVLPLCNGDTNGSITVAASNGTGPYTYSWSTGDTGNMVNGLGAGNYTVTITDDIGCQVVETVTLSEPDPLNDAPTVVNVSCNGFDNGSISLSTAGGTSPYTYLWNTTDTGSSLSGLAPGSYSVAITDANGCVLNKNYEITEPNVLAITSTKTDVLCFGEATGAIDVTVTGGTLPYTYNWSDGRSTEDRSGIVASSYTLTVTDANGCIEMHDVEILQPNSGITVVENITNLSCSGDPTGSIDLNVSGGTAPYTYQWEDGPNLEDRSNLPEGSYTVTITDSNNCQDTRTISINQPDGISIVPTVQNITCNGAGDGAIDLTVSGGTMPYTYLWADGLTTKDRSALSPGGYSIIVTDANGCQTPLQVTITEPDELTASRLKTDVACFGQSTGAVDLSVAGGTLPYTYNWSNGAISQDLNNIVAGTYEVIVTDANGCTTDLSVEIEEPMAALGVIGTVSNESCSGFSNAGVQLSVTGGTMPYSYLWSNGSTDKDITAVFPGTYQVTVTDANGCFVVEEYTITGPQPLTITGTITDLVCYQQADGGIDLTVSGGTGPYTYNWSNGANTEDLNSLLAGDYIVSVTDFNGCSTNANFILTEPNELIVNASASGVSCFGEVDGSIALGVTGGVAPYTYSWSNGTNTEDLMDIVGGDYTVTVTDANGCQVSRTITVSAPTAPLNAIGTITEIGCNGDQTGGVALNVTGGTAPFTFSWSNGSTLQNLSNVFPGNYEVQVTDVNGCTFDTSFLIGEAPALEATFTATEPTCPGDANGSILLEVTGGTGPYTYFWSNGSTSEDQFNLDGGPYTVTIRDANDCTYSQSIDLGGNRGLDIEVNKTDVLCKGEASGAVSLDIFGGTGNYTYSWDNGSTSRDLSGLTAGLYLLTVTDDDGCDANVTVVIAEPAQSLSVTTDYTNKLTCFGGTDGVAEADVSGGTAPYNYLWSTGERTRTISGLSAGTYTVIVEDANGCLTQQTFDILQPDAPIAATFSGKRQLLCIGDQDGSLTANITGGEGPYRLLWSNGSAQSTITNLSAGDYILRVTDTRGCTVEIITSITEPEPLSVTEFIINDTQCYNDRTGSIEITVEGGTAPYTYLWSNGSTSRNIVGIGTGTYNVQITDANGCTWAEVYELDNAPLFELRPQVSPVSCTDERDASISLNIIGGTGAYEISWNTGDGDETISNLGSGTYEVLVRDANGCELQQIFNIINPLPLTADAIVENAIACDEPESGTVTLITSGGTPPYQYSWSNGMTTPTLRNVPAGQYSLTITDSFGCTFQDVYNVTQPNPLEVVLEPEIIIDCENQQAVARVVANVTGGFGPYTYDWSRGTGTEAAVEVNTPGRTAVIVTDGRGCQRNMEVDIEFPGFGQANFTYTSPSLERDEILSLNDPIEFLDRSGEYAVDWRWDFGDESRDDAQNPIHAYASVGVYTVNLTVTDQAGCVTDTLRRLEILKGFRVMYPDAFTPDGDGLNDFFKPKFTGLREVKLIIYNKWGELVFATTDLETDGWDGTIKGELAPGGNYVFQLMGISYNGFPIKETGGFGLIR